jgi:ElaB/YqjD/DUF883 family membrane-anchored ribosome-binding protein
MQDQLNKLQSLVDKLQEILANTAQIAEIRKRILRTQLEAAIDRIESERLKASKRAESGDKTAQRHDYKLCGKREALEDLRTALVCQDLI